MTRWNMALLVAVGAAVLGCGAADTSPTGTPDGGGAGSPATGGSSGAAGTGSGGMAGADSGVGGIAGTSTGGSVGVDAGDGGGSGGTAGVAGTAGSAGAAGTGGQVCTPGAKTCSASDVVTCKSDGSGFTTTETCPYVCVNGACTGSCKPGSTKCLGADVDTCDANGTWAFTQTCAFVCSTGTCTGTCVPGTKQCSGQDAQTCDSNGAWQTDQTCPILCSAGTCTGTCTPGTKQCNGDTTQLCNNAGAWDDIQLCPYVCSSGSCTGSCVPGTTKCTVDTPETCDASGSWVAGSTCPFVCSNGACTGTCTPGTKQCSGTGVQTCDSTGQWGSAVACPGATNADPICSGAGVCGTTCKNGFEDCDGSSSNGCEANLSDPTTCGSCSNACPSQNGTATCSGTTCGISCNQGYANCTSAPGCETQLGTTTNCTACGDSCPAAPANATPVCTSTGCGFACNPTWGDCDGDGSNGCEHDIYNDPENCGACGHVCYGGTCSNGVCSQTVEKIAGTYTPYSIGLNASTVYLGGTSGSGSSTNSAVLSVPKNGGSTSTLSTLTVTWPTSVPIVRPLVTDGVSVYFYDSTAKAIKAVRVGGGSTSTLVSNVETRHLATDGTYVFYTTGDPPLSSGTMLNTCWDYEINHGSIPGSATTQVMKVPVGGGAAVLVHQQAGTYTGGLSTANGKLYVMYCGTLQNSGGAYWYSAQLWDMDKTTGSSTVAAVTETPGPFSVTPTYLVSFEPRRSATGSPGIYRATLGVLPASKNVMIGTTNFPKVLGPDTIVANDTTVYWSGGNSVAGYGDTVNRMSINGGTPAVLAVGQGMTSNLAIDGTHVYWGAFGHYIGTTSTVVADPGVYRTLK